MNFSERLKELRAESGLSAMALGKSIGVSDMAIFEMGKRQVRYYGRKSQKKLAEFFNVTTDYLFGIDGIKKHRFFGAFFLHSF
ncbi:MAG: helix-turn-helix domain-containing protein [Clostridiales bacterium]|nr:MAG: helix-turn-helix domain-containing protein [Clostridiales bacterium]